MNNVNERSTIKKIDLRSDTVTLPTNEMREAMMRAEVGDDVYQEDPTVKQLEKLAAEKVGKEAALFVSSGTMGNLIAVLSHCQRGDEVILETDSHMYYYEVGGLSAVAGTVPKLVTGKKGVLNPKDVKAILRDENIHYPKTSLICLENTHNRAGGTITPPKITKEICQLAHSGNILVHLDGARIFNAAIALNEDPKNLVREVDSVMFCLSKGLCTPVGSILTGSKEFIQKARKNRKMLGGGMRQVGIIAAAGIIALEKMINRLKEDHQNARILGESLYKIEKVEVDLDTIQTNMVYLNLEKSGMGTYDFISKLAKYNVLVSPRPPHHVRMVTHHDIDEKDIYTAVEAVKNVVSEYK